MAHLAGYLLNRRDDLFFGHPPAFAEFGFWHDASLTRRRIPHGRGGTLRKTHFSPGFESFGGF
jgi:hypothetical protein